MLLVNAFAQSIIDAMLADDAFLHSPGGVAVSDIGLVPITAPFTPSRDLLVGDLTYPALGEFDAIAVAAGNMNQIQISNAEGAFGIKIAEPVGGFTWIVGAPIAAPITVYGFALVRILAGVPDELFAAAALVTPVELTVALQVIQASAILGFFDSEMMGMFIEVIPQV